MVKRGLWSIIPGEQLAMEMSNYWFHVAAVLEGHPGPNLQVN